MRERSLSVSKSDQLAQKTESRPADTLGHFGFDIDLVRTVFNTEVAASIERPHIAAVTDPDQALEYLQHLHEAVKAGAGESWDDPEFLAGIQRQFPDIPSYYTLLLKAPWGYHLVENMIAFRTKERLKQEVPIHPEKPPRRTKKTK